MKEKDIKNRHAHIYRLRNLFGLEEMDRIELQPQAFEPGLALTPEATVVIANTRDLYIGIHLAMGEDGIVYCGTDIAESEGGGGFWPSRDGGPRGGHTIREAMGIFLREYLGNYSRYADPTGRIKGLAAETLRRLDSSTVRQMTIFDML